ncbi:hypothetical protein Ae706Ps2_5973c [Pseudonocardia sp. Ae706_Ps2]|nr:hypothetical protein Ae706Ps2_5973c [Pseudonocardia sp. Ae706_Ps2]
MIGLWSGGRPGMGCDLRVGGAGALWEVRHEVRFW